uniref:histidine kinase n=2 Tax=environmental samples TaxID=48479 RepID=A0A1C9U4T3_9BACT|nr:histidine kinase [uncultured bacterium pAY4-1]AOR51206.1 histidine kinase [uncultured bacterium pAY4-2]
MQLRRIVFTRMALILTVMTVLVSGSYGFFAFYHHRQTSQELWLARASILVEGVQRLVLWDDVVALQKLLQSEVAGSPVLQYAFVVTGDEPYVSTLAGGVPSALLRRSGQMRGNGVWEFLDQNDNFMYDVAVESEQPELSLHLGLDRNAIDREVRPLLIANLMISLSVIAVGILLAIILARRTTRDVDALVQALRRYGEGSSAGEESINAESSEVTELIASFKSLAAARNQAKAELLALNTELEERVRDRTAQLAAANQELDAFAYSVSHDLRAPLRGIDGFSLALVEDFGDALSAEGKDYLRRIRAGCGRMGTLIDDLLYLSRLARNPLRREVVDLSLLARQVADELQQLDPARQIDWVIAPELLTVADPSLIRAVLDNLLGNAWKFTGKQGQARIEFGGFMQGDEEVYFVKDNGAGFDMLYADKLFKVFQRLHKVEEFDGSGIGLATVQRVIQRHGGRVWAQGEIGQGATFYFSLREEHQHEG